jgi:putative transposase
MEKHMDVLQNKSGHVALRKGRVSLTGQIYLVTSVTYKRELWFADFNRAAVVARSFGTVFSQNGSSLLAWVLMPDHAHWLLQLGHDETLSSIIKRLKSVSGRELNHLLTRSGAVWDIGFHDHALRSDEDIKAVPRYIIANPIRAGLVKRVGDYLFWNAVWL